jgi:tape measure domain-containing protein
VDAEGLKLKIDSKGAQQDLAALSKVLDKTSASADKLDRAFAKAAQSTDQNLTKAARSMEKYAQVAALLSKIKIAGNPVGQIQELGKALDAIGRAKQINVAQVAAVKELGAALGTLRVSERVFGVATFLNSLGRVRVPSQAQVRNVRDFFAAIATFKGTAGSEQLSRLLATLSTARAPSQGTIDRLQRMFVVLASAREMPGAGRIANQLDTIALAAGRASRALQSVPGNRALLSAGGATPRSSARAGAGAAAGDASKLGKALSESEIGARKAAGSFGVVGRGLDDMSGRFRLSYQAGTLFTTMFASFTAGHLVRSLYDTNIALLKLQKAMLFATGTFKGAEDATSEFIGISQKLGLSIQDNIDTYGRFVIASTASGLKLKQTNDIYDSLATALTVVGASAQQQQLALYGLTEMIQKGVVYSKEFNRQIGAQLPGNAVLGAQALSHLHGKMVSVSDFFKEMHSGTLLSATFVPEWARAVKEMYSPLLSLAQQRPDVAIQRLKNSFVIFAREVGGGKFMSSIGNEMKRLTALIIEGDGANAHLTSGFQHLADQIGQGLGTAIHALGSGIEFVVSHFDTLFTAVKGFLAFKVAGEFASIANSVMKATDKMFGFASATNMAAAAEARVSQEARVTATQTAVAAIAAPGANQAAAISNLASGRSFGRRTPATAFQRGNGVIARPSFGQRLNLPLFNYADEVEARAARARPTFSGGPASISGLDLRRQMNERRSMLGAGANIFGSAVTKFSVGGAARAVGGGIGMVFEKAASAMSLLGPAATAAAIGLALFSDKASGLKSKGGNDITYGDIASGAFATVGESVQGFVKSIGESFGMFGENSLTLGKVVLGVAAIIKATVSLMFDLAHALGTMIGGAISSMVVQIIKWGKVISDVIHGNITGAIADYRAGNAAQAGITKSTQQGVFSDFDKIFGPDSLGETYKKMLKNSGISADGRSSKHVNDADAKQIEAAVQQQAAAQANMRAATLMEDTMAQFNKDTQKIDYGTLREQIVNLIDGTYARRNLPRTGAASANAAATNALASIGSPVSPKVAAGADSPNLVAGTGGMIYKTAFAHMHESEVGRQVHLAGLVQDGRDQH